jgi:hypothetical protein
MKVAVGQSCYVYCVPDPLGILKPDEIHLGFSNAFQPQGTQETETMLHDIDALVARSPAHTRTDVRKVRCVFEPKLHALKDVVVFPTTGEIPLAHLLSGGDYDGDKIWVCWDRDIVEPFENAPITPSLTLDNLQFDKRKCRDHPLERRCESFLLHNLHLTSQPQMLGICTNYKESYCYETGTLASKEALALSELLSNLVDAPKMGLLLDTEDFQVFLADHGLPKNVKDPFYKRFKGPIKPPAPHVNIVDHLYFDIVYIIIEDAKKAFQANKADRNDPQLTKPWHEIQKDAEKDPTLKAVLTKLKGDLEAIKTPWSQFTAPKPYDHAPDRKFKDTLLESYLQYTAILPDPSEHPLISSWIKYADQQSSEWKLLKASALYALCLYQCKSFPWYMAGRELGFIKCRASGSLVPVIADIYSSLKPDAAYIERRKQSSLAKVEFHLSDSEDSGDEMQYSDALTDEAEFFDALSE